jgi:predicted ATPase
MRYRCRVSIPDELRSTVLRRLSQLTRTERSVVMRAAAVGRHFRVSVLADVAARDETAVRAVLERASALQIVEASGPDRYAFRHALTRDIIYEECFNGPVRALHRRIARALEKAGGGNEALADLAYHAWASGDCRRSVRYNERAGDNAAALHADDDARRYYQRARSTMAFGSTAYVRLTEKLRAIGTARPQ